jgi:hypothetical protein
MNIALILSTLLIGASTLNTPDNNALTMPPTSDLPLPPIQNNSTTPQTQTRAQKAEQDRNAQRKQAKTSRASEYSGHSQQQNAQNMRPMMPSAPTDSSAGSRIGQSYNFLPPTADAASAGSDPNGGYAGLPDRMNVPTSPTRARPGEAQSYTSMRAAEESRRLAASRNSASAPAQLTPKAFSSVSSQSSSGSSPYMNLYRTGNNNGTIDNYTTLVRPQLDQQGTNQKFGADIHGLENSTHIQGLNIRQLNRETQTLQGVNATQYFMNYGDYYQGAR